MAKRSKKKSRSQEVTGVAQTPARAQRSITKGKFALLQMIVIVMAGLWVFWPALHGDWLWDDSMYITQNPSFYDPSGLWKIWFKPGNFIEYYPVEETVQWAQWQLWQNETFGYHLTNVILHILSALLIWRLLSKFGLHLAWLGGLIFVLHPVQVESVAWISELKNTLSLPPFLLAMCAWIDYEEHRRRNDYLMALGMFLVAMLCKISMALFPVVILLYAWWKRGRVGWGDLKAGLPFFGISLVLGFTTVWAGENYLQQDGGSSEVVLIGGFFSRLILAGLSILFYFSKCFLPVDLLPAYPKWTVNPLSPIQFLPWIVLIGAIAWLWIKRRTWGRHAILGFGFFLINLAPFVGFIEASYMNFTWVMDHFLYIPIIGLIGLAVAGLGRLGDQLSVSGRRLGIGVVTITMGLLAWESHGYAGIFTSQETLWTYALQYNPEAWPGYLNLGDAWEEKGRVSETIELYEKALKINPDFVMGRYNLGNAFIKANRFPEAIEQYEQALKINPRYVDAHNNLGRALFQIHRLPEAIEQFEQALKIDPNDIDARNNLGNSLIESNRIPEAIDQYEQILKINPNYAIAHANMATAFIQINRIPEAIQQYELYLKLDPDNADVRNQLAHLQGLQQTAPVKVEQK